jgi:hypothetical protein
MRDLKLKESPQNFIKQEEEAKHFQADAFSFKNKK